MNLPVVADTITRQPPRLGGTRAAGCPVTPFAKGDGVAYSIIRRRGYRRQVESCTHGERVLFLKKKKPPYEKPVLEPLLIVGEGQSPTCADGSAVFGGSCSPAGGFATVCGTTGSSPSA